jgi:hypothetical protein
VLAVDCGIDTVDDVNDSGDVKLNAAGAPVNCEYGNESAVRVVIVEFEVATRLAAALPGPVAVTSPVKAVIAAGAPVNCEYGRERADNVVNVELDVNVELPVPPFNIGTMPVNVMFGVAPPLEDRTPDALTEVTPPPPLLIVEPKSSD